jgi:hypothetical protein
MWRYVSRRFLLLLRSQKFKLVLVIEVVLIILYRLQVVELDSLPNVFWISSMIFGIYLFGLILGYHCQSCNKNQVYKSTFSYRLPTSHCWSCNEIVEKTET